MAWRLGIDTGGTFTDVLALNSETDEWRTHKIWSRHDAPGSMLEEAFRSLGLQKSEIESITFGTTIVTNALIENRLSETALIATKGFKDTLWIGRQTRNHLYDMNAVPRPQPLVPMPLSFEVNERIGQDGNIEQVLLADEIRSVAKLLPPTCKAVGVVFLHAYKNNKNEVEAAAALVGNVEHISISSEISPEAREYERMAATVLNASLLPTVQKFLKSLVKAYDGEAFFLFHSAGGLIPINLAGKYPLTLAMSGPSAGVEAARSISSQLGKKDVVSLDMGGTTTDCCLIRDGVAQIVTQAKLGQHDVRQPMVAVETVGAGGGSIIDLRGDSLTVGPESAGASPGPACYGRGGTKPTLADAAAVLGYFGTADTLDRPVKIDIAAAQSAFRPLAEQLNLSIEEVAVGAIAIGNAIMSRAIKAITMDKGIDARNCSVIGFGGAGPMFVCPLAKSMGISSVIVPAFSSSLSALGCLTSASSLTRQQTVRINQKESEDGSIMRACMDLENILRDELLSFMPNEPRENVNVTRIALMRYAGQSYEIEVPLTDSNEDLTKAFTDAHNAHYGFVASDPWICEAVRITISVGQNSSLTIQNVDLDSNTVIPESTTCYFNNFGWKETRQVARDSLTAGTAVEGPVLILSQFSTVVVPPGCRAKVIEGQHIEIEVDYEQHN
ncbi:hydantoinase/oxoprolinase family protein [Sneathiella sp. HT1-7]|uniref:hydantoinase/oxoprolinase family protein n=1 Tax=Sneathiella sp. HT1-7 TaxID=2887192 RepID=UPI001D15E3D2|nr:hydantoinase/oxoprolinase family protein [Sneathiella sp. HT1-7]MCC3306358.1 hydantoinase/oxoprolinase family protein [Sneathiella sp. HT1-7]